MESKVWPRDQLVTFLATIRITIRIWESVPQITIRIREELAFGGGLCSLSTSSLICG